MSNTVFVNLKITPKSNGEGTFLKGYRKDTNENYFVFTNKDDETGEITSRKLCRGTKVPQGEQSDLVDVGYLGLETGQFGKYLACWGHKINKNRFFKDGKEINGVMYKTNQDGELLTFPSGDNIPMEEMTLVINLEELSKPQPSNQDAGLDDIPF